MGVGRRLFLRLIFPIGIVGAAFVAQSSEKTKEKKMPFLVPEGSAVLTLKKAARQGGVDIVFSADIVEGVKTPSLSGNYTPGAAFSLMLRGTQLVAVRHAESGVYLIKKPKSKSPKFKDTSSRETIN